MMSDGFLNRYSPDQSGDDFDVRAADWVATLAEPERSQYAEILMLGRDILSKLADCRRTLRNCNVIAARTIGHIERAAAEHHAWEVEHAR